MEYTLKEDTLSKMLDICLERGSWFDNDEFIAIKSLKDIKELGYECDYIKVVS